MLTEAIVQHLRSENTLLAGEILFEHHFLFHPALVFDVDI